LLPDLDVEQRVIKALRSHRFGTSQCLLYLSLLTLELYIQLTIGSTVGATWAGIAASTTQQSLKARQLKRRVRFFHPGSSPWFRG
jgi:hypothetical protein